MIGIFDSGSGGLTVAAALRRQAPHVDVVYFGDLANMPYGEKSVVELEQLTFAAIRFLRARGADFIISACNSVSCLVIMPMLEVFGGVNPHIIEMVGPATAVLRDVSCPLTVAATEATVASGMYQSALKKYGITPNMLPVSGLAAAIEHNDQKTIEKIIDEILFVVEQNESRTLLLACTHYPLVHSKFIHAAKMKKLSLHIIDPAEFVATSALAQYKTQGKGTLQFFISKESPQFNTFVKTLFGSADYQITIHRH